MAYMAKWGPKGFIVSPNKIVALEGLKTSLSLKQDSENDTSGTQTTNTRGRDLRPITFKVQYLASVGVDPRAQIASWEAELGNSYPLYIGGERFGEPLMKLIKVDTSDVLLSNSGAFIKATVAITLEEYAEGKSSKLVKNKSGKDSETTEPSASALQAAEKYRETVKAKKAALAATASPADKAQKKSTA